MRQSLNFCQTQYVSRHPHLWTGRVKRHCHGDAASQRLCYLLLRLWPSCRTLPSFERNFLNSYFRLQSNSWANVNSHHCYTRVERRDTTIQQWKKQNSTAEHNGCKQNETTAETPKTEMLTTDMLMSMRSLKYGEWNLTQAPTQNIQPATSTIFTASRWTKKKVSICVAHCPHSLWHGSQNFLHPHCETHGRTRRCHRPRNFHVRNNDLRLDKKWQEHEATIEHNY